MSRLRPAWLAAAAGVLAAIAVGVAIGRTVGGGAPPAASASGTTVSARAGTAQETRAVLEALRADLEQETFDREMLAAEVELMRTVLEQLAASASSVAGDEPAQVSERPAGGRPPPGALDLDEARLAAIGLSEGEVYDLRDRWDRAQLARLELNDRAAREGWLLRPRHRRQLQRLDDELRKELGERDYDRMLYATGQPNRVVVRSVIGGSAAEIAGLREGDYVLSYGAERTYRPGDVRRGTTAGVRGEPVRVIVERSGQRLSFLVPRGPLGVRMAAEQAPPTP